MIAAKIAKIANAVKTDVKIAKIVKMANAAKTEIAAKIALAKIIAVKVRNNAEMTAQSVVIKEKAVSTIVLTIINIL